MHNTRLFSLEIVYILLTYVFLNDCVDYYSIYLYYSASFFGTLQGSRPAEYLH